MELENIYLRGRFSVVPDASGFRIVAPGTLTFGSWAGQGWSFYAGTVRYSTQVEVPAGQDTLGIELKDWHGSMAQVFVDGKPSATLQWPPYRVELPAKPGKHSVDVRVISTPRNTFGPYHHPHRPRFTSSDGYYREFPEHQPAGKEYQIVDYGINTAPFIATAAGGSK
jgi:hypothetical protein